MVEPGLVGMDATLMKDIGRGYGHGKWSMDAMLGPSRDHFPNILLPMVIYLHFTICKELAHH